MRLQLRLVKEEVGLWRKARSGRTSSLSDDSSVVPFYLIVNKQKIITNLKRNYVEVSR